MRPRGARLIETAGGRVQGPLESPRPRCHSLVLSHVPLAGHGGKISRRSQHFRKRGAFIIQVAAISRCTLIVRHKSDSGLVRVKTGQERRPRGATTSSIIELRKSQATGGE